jgi:transposase
VNAEKKPIKFKLTPGNEHDITMVEPLMKEIDAKSCLADKAYDAQWVIDMLNRRGIEPVIPQRSNATELRDFNEELYGIRYQIECFFFELKRFRRIATRFEKTARNFAAFISLACAMFLAA